MITEQDIERIKELDDLEGGWSKVKSSGEYETIQTKSGTQYVYDRELNRIYKQYGTEDKR